MMAGWAVRSAWLGRPAGRKMGAWAAVGIWLTPESMPFLLASFGGLGLFWSRHPEDRNAGMALRAAGTTFFVLVAAALAVDPPLDGYFTAETYRLSVVYLVLAAIACANGWTLWWLDRQPLRPGLRGIIAVLVALSGLALWLALFPAILAGPEGLLSAEVARVFMRPISELQPIRTARDAAIFIGAGALAVLAAGIIAVRARSPVWAFATVCGVLLIVLASHYRRFATYPEIIAVAILPIIASAFDSSFWNHRQSLRSAIRVVVLSILYYYRQLECSASCPPRRRHRAVPLIATPRTL